MGNTAGTPPKAKTIRARELADMREMLSNYRKEEQVNKMVISFLLREDGVVELFEKKEMDFLEGIDYLELSKTKFGIIVLVPQGIYHVIQPQEDEQGRQDQD